MNIWLRDATVSDIRAEGVNTRAETPREAGLRSDGELVQARARDVGFTAAAQDAAGSQGHGHGNGGWTPILSTGSGRVADGHHDDWSPILSLPPAGHHTSRAPADSLPPTDMFLFDTGNRSPAADAAHDKWADLLSMGGGHASNDGGDGRLADTFVFNSGDHHAVSDAAHDKWVDLLSVGGGHVSGQSHDDRLPDSLAWTTDGGIGLDPAVHQTDLDWV